MKRTASGGGPIGRSEERPFLRTGYGAVLEFEFLSRIIASKQSMVGWRLGPAPVSLQPELGAGRRPCVSRFAFPLRFG